MLLLLEVLLKIYATISEAKIYFFNLSILLYLVYHFTGNLILIKKFLFSRINQISDRYEKMNHRYFRAQVDRSEFVNIKWEFILDINIFQLDGHRAIQQQEKYYYDLFFYELEKLKKDQKMIINIEKNKIKKVLINKLIQNSIKKAKEKIKLRLNNKINHQKFNALSISILQSIER